MVVFGARDDNGEEARRRKDLYICGLVGRRVWREGGRRSERRCGRRRRRQRRWSNRWRRRRWRVGRRRWRRRLRRRRRCVWLVRRARRRRRRRGRRWRGGRRMWWRPWAGRRGGRLARRWLDGRRRRRERAWRRRQRARACVGRVRPFCDGTGAASGVARSGLYGVGGGAVEIVCGGAGDGGAGVRGLEAAWRQVVAGGEENDGVVCGRELDARRWRVNAEGECAGHAGALQHDQAGRLAGRAIWRRRVRRRWRRNG